MNRRTLLTAILVILLPALAGAVIVHSAATPQETASSVPAAIVNLDTPATTAEGTTLPAGRLLTGRLTNPREALTAESRTVSQDLADDTLDYSVVSAETAAAGLDDGTYDVVITIPADFSASMAASLEGTPTQAPITIATSEGASAEVGALSQSVVDAAASSLGTTVTLAYVTGGLEATGSLSTSLDQAATGASTLSDGVSTYTGGVDALHTQVTTPDPATGYDLAGGASAAASGAAQAYSLCVASHGPQDPTCQALAQVAGATSGVSSAIGSSTDVYDPATGMGGSVVGVLAALSSQSSALTSGATELSDGLGQAADSVPSYDEQQAVSMAEAVTQPVTVDAGGVQAKDAQDGLAPAAAAIALWLGALVAVSGLGVMSRRTVESAATPGRLAWRSLRPALVIAVLQALVLAGVLAATGVGLGKAAGAVGVLVLGSVTMTLLHAALTAGLGGRMGSAVSLLALVVQVVGLGAATSTGPMAGLASWVQAVGPLNLVAQALSSLMLGPGGAAVVGVGGAVALLVAWCAAGGVFMVLAVRRRRWTSVSELRRQLAAAAA